MYFSKVTTEKWQNHKFSFSKITASSTESKLNLFLFYFFKTPETQDNE